MAPAYGVKIDNRHFDARPINMAMGGIVIVTVNVNPKNPVPDNTWHRVSPSLTNAPFTTNRSFRPPTILIPDVFFLGGGQDLVSP